MAFTPGPVCRPRSYLVPLLASLALHGLLGLLAQFALSHERPDTGRSLPIAACRILPEGPLFLSLASPSRPRRTPAAVKPVASGAEEEEALFPVRVLELPVRPGPPPLAAAPVPGPDSPGERGSVGPQSKGADGSAGQPAGVATTFFRVPARGQSVVFVLDHSVSMGLSGALKAARQELLDSLLHRMPASARFQVILYNRTASPLKIGNRTDLLLATPANKGEAARLLLRVLPEGGTDHLQALRRALLLRPDVIYLVTDADEMTGEQIREVTRLNRGQTAIHAVALGRQARAGGPLEQLVISNRGTFTSVIVSP